MPIDPNILASGGSLSGVQRQIQDLKRQLSALGISGGSLGAGSITAGNLGNGVIVASNIQAGAITTVTLAAGAITAITIAAGAIVAGKIAADAVISGTVAADVITSREIAAGAVQASEIAAGAVTATKISVSDLQSVAATMGTVTAGIFQTANTGARLMVGTSISTSEGNKNGIVGLDASNNITFLIEPATGDARFKGVVQAGSSGLGNIDGLTQNSALVISGANLATNATFDANITGFVSFGGATIAYTTTKFYSAPGAAQVTSSGASYTNGFNGGSLQAATAGKPYSLSIVIQTPATVAARTITVGFNFYNASSVQIGAAVTAVNTSLPGQWKKCLVENVIAPAGTAFILPFYTATAVASEIHYVDNVIFAQSTTASGSIIVANSITATEIGVSSLSAITANMGTLTAGSITSGTISGVTITGATITGSTLKTATTGGRFEITSGAFGGFNASGINTLSMDTAGNIYNYASGSAYNSINWLNSPTSGQYTGHLTMEIGVPGNVNGGSTVDNVISVQARSSTNGTASPAARSQLLAYNQAGFSSTGVQLAVEYLTSGTSFIFARNNGYYVNVLNGNNTSGYARGPKSGATSLDHEYRLWMGAGVGLNFTTGGYNTWNFAFGGSMNAGTDPNQYIGLAYFVQDASIGGAEFLNWILSTASGNTFNTIVAMVGYSGGCHGGYAFGLFANTV